MGHHRQVGPASFEGKARLVFFGVTHRPDVCPAGLSLMSQLVKEFGSEGKNVQAMFISIDLERDTVDMLRSHMSVFAADRFGPTGTPEQTEEMCKAFSAHVNKVPLPSGGCTVDHAAPVCALDRSGTFHATIDIHEKQDVALHKICRIVAKLAPR